MAQQVTGTLGAGLGNLSSSPRTHLKCGREWSLPGCRQIATHAHIHTVAISQVNDAECPEGLSSFLCFSSAEPSLTLEVINTALSSSQLFAGRFFCSHKHG